ncbi:MAG: HAMP domain-containing histidine kinase [Bryobacterales bacterium]|nr:HAMP domain-containing histidine kinase [Bryobacterales bacterium]
MKPRLTAVLLLIVAAPLAIVGWLGARVVRDEQAVVEHRFQELIGGQLRAVDAAIATSLDAYRERVLEQMRPFTPDRAELRRRSRESPLAIQFYVLGADGKVEFPPVDSPGDLAATEREALRRTAQIWDGGDLGAGAGESETGSETGWKAWYWGNGLQMMLWTRDANRIHAAEINRTRLLAELVGALPETDAAAPELADGRIRLLDATGAVLYQWGALEDEDDVRTAVRFPLRAPLNAWTLEYVSGGGAAFGSAVTGGFLLTLIPSLALLGVVVIGLAYYFYREQSREAREAEQRVSFVNQVSHELKTPLTNIRMYAEMLEQGPGEADPRMARYLGVIVSESQRLSRLIANVLTFSRKQHHALNLRFEDAVPDDVLRTAVEHFRPALEAKGLAVELDLRAGESRRFDPDVLGQIAANLVSNVEKYAAAGEWLRIESCLRDGTIEICVEDRGPGIQERERGRIFEPFYRIHNSLTEGVSGTGIGLSISRDLARLHGGDVVLEPGGEGARFRVILQCQPEGGAA